MIRRLHYHYYRLRIPYQETFYFYIILYYCVGGVRQYLLRVAIVEEVERNLDYVGSGLADSDPDTLTHIHHLPTTQLAKHRLPCYSKRLGHTPYL